MAGTIGRWRARFSAFRRQQAAFVDVEQTERRRVLVAIRADADTIRSKTVDRVPHLLRPVIVPSVVIARRISVDDVGTHAGALAYGALLSTPPLLIFALSVVGFVLAGNTQAQAAVIDGITDLFPTELVGSAQHVLSEQMSAAVAGRLSLGIIGLVGLLWSASGLASRIRHAFGTIFCTERTGLLTGRFGGMVIGIPVILALFGLVALSALEVWVSGFGPHETVAKIAVIVAVVAGEFVFFLAVYWLLTPGKGPRIRDHLPGAIVALAGWEGLKFVGGFFFAKIVADSSALYGALGGLFGIIAFLYATAWLILFGAECSAYRWQRAWTAAPPVEAGT